MNKYSEYFGVGISKDVFDVHEFNMGHKQFKNEEKGFLSFLKSISKESFVIMEAMGYSHYRLAQFLCKKGVSVLVKCFIQMKLAFAIAKSGIPYDEDYVSKLN